MGSIDNIIPHKHSIKSIDRHKHKGHNSFVLWFTGLSGSGKSSIADRVEQMLYEDGIHTYLLDGDNIRTGLNQGLGFTEEDRNENLRRIGEVCKLFVDAGIVTIAAFVSPLEKDRQLVQGIIGSDLYIEIFVNTSLEECERRDVKGLYKKARAGEIKNFTGINSPYDEPRNPDIEIKTGEYSIEESAQLVIDYVKQKLKLKS